VTYNHWQLYSTFEKLISDLSNALTYIHEEKVKYLPLKYYDQHDLYQVTFKENDFFNFYQVFILAIKVAIPRSQVTLMLPKLIKIASKEDISTIINRQLPGLKIEYLPSVPREIPYLADYSYFLVDQNSPLWQNIKSSQILTIYLAKRLPNFDIKLWAIKSQKELKGNRMAVC